MNLTERQREILFAIIEQYAELANPVGSVTLAKLFDVSSATIRAEMAKLESLGLIAQPHTSAGRIPTDAGYRYYVNSLTEESEGPAYDVPRLESGETYDRGAHFLELRVALVVRKDIFGGLGLSLGNQGNSRELDRLLVGLPFQRKFNTIGLGQQGRRAQQQNEEKDLLHSVTFIYPFLDARNRAKLKNCFEKTDYVLIFLRAPDGLSKNQPRNWTSWNFSFSHC